MYFTRLECTSLASSVLLDDASSEADYNEDESSKAVNENIVQFIQKIRLLLDLHSFRV